MNDEATYRIAELEAELDNLRREYAFRLEVCERDSVMRKLVETLYADGWTARELKLLLQMISKRDLTGQV